MRLAPGEESGDSCEKIGQRVGRLQSVWELEWSRMLEMSADCGYRRWISLMSMSVSALSVHSL